ncbi:MAG: hypothetical protein U5L76_01990 [Patescibacteria group bacterium]|nr:hypothetical protein [Patescibacteria group bacterium]
MDILLRKIDNKIDKLCVRFQENKGYILTESDLKCAIYSELVKISILNKFTQTEDRDIFSNPVHTELSWYDENDKLNIIPDITILEPKNLSILHYKGRPGVKLPSKQCSFWGNAIVFELKFIRNKKGITPKTIHELQKDYLKVIRLIEIFSRHGSSNELFVFLIVFNKTNIVCNEFKDFMKDVDKNRRVRLLYKTGNAKFPSFNQHPN